MELPPVKVRAEPYYWWYKHRGLAMAPLVVVMFACRWAEIETESVIWPLGLLVFAAGLLLRVWAQRHLHYHIHVGVGKTLTRTGPYRYVRNPLYIGNTVMLAGLAVMCELLWMVPVALAYCAVVYGLVTRHEERHLAGKYGKPYLEYMAAVPRWFPRLTPSGTGSPASTYRIPAVLGEVHNLLLLLLPLVKEILDRA
jgi:protein-S-isoprenylcysteine O-methyltransferase Ste14